VFRLKDLTVKILWEHDGVLLPRRLQRRVTDIDQIGAEGEMGTVLFQDAERQKASALRFLNRFREIFSRELLPPG